MTRPSTNPIVVWTRYALLALSFAVPSVASAASPNGFQPPQCTWYCDVTAFSTGWKLQFTQSTGRDAGLWYYIVKNGYCADGPRAGTIMVLGSNHVAWVESAGSGKWTVTHSNFPYGRLLKYIDG